MKRLTPIWAFIGILLCCCINLSGQTIYVNASAAPGGNGSSWNSAYNNLSTALLFSSSGNELWVVAGNYGLTGANDRFTIPTGVKLLGGFSGGEVLASQRDWKLNTTTLNGNNIANSVVYIYNGNSNTHLDGFTIQNGNANGTGGSEIVKSGAGVFVKKDGNITSDPLIQNCTFQNNFASRNGGGVYLDGSFNNSGLFTPQIINCAFNNNGCSLSGGGLYISGAGGASTFPILRKCSFSNNSSGDTGAAIYNSASTIGSTSNPFIQACQFSNNAATGPGGAIYNNGANGGQANANISDCTFFSNTALSAGGIYNNGGNTGQCNPNITNCTFFNNSTQQNGGAIYNNGSSGTSSPVISNCIIYGNSAPFNNSDNIRNVSATPTIRYSLVDATSCTDLLDLNNGGSTVTCGAGMIYNQNPLFVNGPIGNLRLVMGSPALETGNNSDNFNLLDADCNPRKVNIIDMGAYELEDQMLPVELAEFQAYLDEDKVTLFWITLSEEDNASFTIERSRDGRDFEELQTIPGAGNVSTARSYKEFDHHPKPGKNYYRIRNTSFSGEEEYSLIRVVELQPQKITIFPNPVADQIQIAFADFNADEAQYRIFNILGKEVFSGTIEVDANVSIIQLDRIGELIPGTYILQIETSLNGRFSQRFEKIRD